MTAPREQQAGTKPSDGGAAKEASDQSHVKAALFIFLVILCSLALMVWHTGGQLMRAHWALLYIGIALLTGVIFWTLTGSKGKFATKSFGIELTGGAAIGAAFMMLAHHLVGDAPRTVVVPLRTGDAILEPRIIQTDPGIAAELLMDHRRVLVEFRGDGPNGWFMLKALNPDASGWQLLRYDVTTEGKIDRTVDNR